jgi:hypothetical protein
MRRRQRLGRLTGLVAAAMVGWLLASGGFSHGATATAAPTDQGAPTIYNKDGTAVITSGGSTTPFRLGNASVFGTLPGSGACLGDTQTNKYQVWTYLTFDNSTNGGAPTTLTFTQQAPGSFFTNPAAYASEPPTPAVPLADFQGNVWGGSSTPEPTAPKTGAVIGLPEFAFAPLFATDFAASESAAAAAGQDLFPGTWDLGVACTAPGSAAPDNYWNVRITFTAVPKGTASGQDPNGFVWAVASTSPPPPTTTTTTTTPTTSTPGSGGSTTGGSSGGATGGAGSTGASGTAGTSGTGSSGTGASGTGASGTGGSAGTTTDPPLAATGSPVGKEALGGLLILLLGTRLVLVVWRRNLRMASSGGESRSHE